VAALGAAQRLRAAWRDPNLRALAAAFAVLTTLLVAWQASTRWNHSRLLAQRRDQETVRVGLYANALSLAIQREVSRLSELHAFVQANPSDPLFARHFNVYAAALYDGSTGIRSLMVAPGGAVTYVYPLAGNQPVIGYRPSDDPRPAVQADAGRALTSTQPVISKPLQLPRGAVGLMAYQAVQSDRGYWGLVSMVLDVSALYSDAGLSAPSGGFALRDAAGRVFYGPAEVYARDPITATVQLPEGAWELGYVPQGGWQVPVEEHLAFDLAGLAIALLLAGLTYLVTNRQQRLALAVERRSAEIAVVNARLQAAALEERQRLARELHDSVSQALYGIGLGAQTARRLVERDPARAVEPLDYVLSLTKAAIAEMRALIFELRPDSLEREGLAAALARQAEAVAMRHKLELHSAFCAEPALSLEAKEALYRIAQEALSNIARHARAGRVELTLSVGEGSVTLAISDDGVGFDTQREYPGHLGLRSMAERAQGVGGRLEVTSAPGQGSWVLVTVPVQML